MTEWGTRCTWQEHGVQRCGIVWGHALFDNRTRVLVPSGPPGYARFIEVPTDIIRFQEKPANSDIPPTKRSE